MERQQRPLLRPTGFIPDKPLPPRIAVAKLVRVLRLEGSSDVVFRGVRERGKLGRPGQVELPEKFGINSFGVLIFSQRNPQSLQPLTLKNDAGGQRAGLRSLPR